MISFEFAILDVTVSSLHSAHLAARNACRSWYTSSGREESREEELASGGGTDTVQSAQVHAGGSWSARQPQATTSIIDFPFSLFHPSESPRHLSYVVRPVETTVNESKTVPPSWPLILMPQFSDFSLHFRPLDHDNQD